MSCPPLPVNDYAGGTMLTVHYKVASGHRENFSPFFKPFKLLPPDCLPESPISIDSESVIQIKIGALLELQLDRFCIHISF